MDEQKSVSESEKFLSCRGRKQVVIREDRREDKQVQMGLDLTSYLFLAGLWVVFLFQPAAALAECPRGWMSYKRSCFGFFSLQLTWGDSEVACQKFGETGHLASFHDREDLLVITKYIKQVNTDGIPTWIGMYDTKKGSSRHNREFKWTDESPVLYMPWAAGEPNIWNNIEHCVELLSKDFDLMNDKDCYIKQSYICKFQPA
ncbi:C-type lectin APL-like [Anolis sagrei]|uniref:C-type lectin APL-like n=1 Tax=Anolis sagrei TaxID=38937 RepID=UPI003521DF23